MAVAFYMDVHVAWAITRELRARGVDVLTADEDQTTTLPDDQLLQRAGSLGRLIFTHDIGFRDLAYQWQRESRQFGGLLFGHFLGGTIGQYVRDLHLIAVASDAAEWMNLVDYLPYPTKG